MTLIYLGTRVANVGTVVTADGEPLPLRLDLVRHSPTGFEWGYGGSGPAQLAVALLAHHFGGADDQALALHQRFKWDVIAKLNGDRWLMTPGNIDDWLRYAAEPSEVDQFRHGERPHSPSGQDEGTP